MNNATQNTNSRPPLVGLVIVMLVVIAAVVACLLYTSPSPRDRG